MQNDRYMEQLTRMEIKPEALRTALDILKEVPPLQAELENPSVPREKKESIIQKIFPRDSRSFLLTLAEDGALDQLEAIIQEYTEKPEAERGPLECVLEYVTAPDEQQFAGIRKFLEKKYPGRVLSIQKKENPSLESGFVLRAGTQEYDWSQEGRRRLLEEKLSALDITGKTSITAEKGIISILRGSLEDVALESQEIGAVRRVGDGIAYIDGVDHAMYGEILVFENGLKGMVQDIRRDEIGCILFGKEDEICEGTKAVRTGRMAGIPVGDGFIGRVVDALGAPLDGKGPVESFDYRPVEEPAPGITDRSSVDTPLETGILAIDSMFPIGRGQRELIIGDRQTGKTSIAVDTILNQKGKGVVCIYVAIGQKASTIANIVKTLEEYGAMAYTTVVVSTASDLAPLQYIAPYSGCAIGEEWMEKGEDVLVVYDDLSKHATAYRTLSLLLRRPPGREAYPGDVFYLHSRLLERAARMNEEYGGGSLTALPIIETQAGDVSAYIPTNVISITDGQIYLETEMFNSGFRPAINAGLSVSRVGGAAQIKAMKKIAAPIRTELAQFRELASFAQFGSELDNDTKEKLAQGERIREVLKQPQYAPMAVQYQVIIIYAVTHKYLLDIPTEDITRFEKEFFDFLNTKYPEVPTNIATEKVISDETEKELQKAIEEFKKQFMHAY